MKFVDWAKQYAKRHNLEFLTLGQSYGKQYRVKNGNKYVDFWNTGSFRTVDGTFFRIGSRSRGHNLNNLDSFGDTVTDIKEEIKKLVN